MPSGATETYDKQSMETILHRRRYASFIKIKFAILNPLWKRYNYEDDLDTWQRLQELIQGDFKYNPDDFFESNSNYIDHLYSTYVRTKSGGWVNPNRSVREKFLILSKGPMRELENFM